MSTRTAGKGMSVIGYNGAMDVVARARGRLFERPDAPRPCRITPRDLALLANLARLRLASGEQLAALDGGSEQNVSRSLLALWEHDYVERLLGQVDRRLLYKGSFPIIYGLTRPGAWLLRKHGYDVRRRLLVRNRQAAPGRLAVHRTSRRHYGFHGSARTGLSRSKRPPSDRAQGYCRKLRRRRAAIGAFV